MKRRVALWAIVIAAVAVASCVRDEDLDLLKHPVHVTGELTPGYGAPIGYGQLTISNVISMLSDTYRGSISADADTVAIEIDTTLVDTLYNMAKTSAVSSPLRTGVFTKDGGISKDTTISYGLDLAIFDDAAVDTMLNGHISIVSLLFSMNTFIKAECPDTVRQIIKQYASATIDNMLIHYTSHDGTVYPFTEFTFPTMTIAEILDGDSVNAYNVEMRDIINRLPTHIEVSYQLHFRLSSDFFTDHGSDANYNEMLDSINKLYFHYNARAHVKMPLNIHLEDLPYNINIAFSGDSLTRLNLQEVADSIAEGLTVHLDSAYLILAFTNGLPMEFKVDAALLDSNRTILGNNIITNGIIQPATTQPTDATNTCFKRESDVTSRIYIHLDEERIRELHKAKSMYMSLRVSGNQGSDPANSIIIGPEDYMRIKVYVQIHPSARLDMRLTHDGIIN